MRRMRFARAGRSYEEQDVLKEHQGHESIAVVVVIGMLEVVDAAS